VQLLFLQIGVPLATLAQALPHLPQSFTSDFVSTHESPQRIVGKTH